MKRVWGVLVIAASCWATAARAEVVTDGPFSIDVKGAEVCVVGPDALRTGAHCDGLEVPPASAFDKLVEPTGLRVVWVAILRAPNGRAPLGVLQILKSPAGNVWPDQRAADEFARTYTKDLSLSPPAKPRVSDVRVVKNGDTRVVRATVDLDGVPPTDAAALSEHQEVATTYTSSGAYLMFIGGPKGDAAALAAIAAASVPTIALDAAARPQRNLSGALGQLFVYVAMAIAGCAIYLSRKRTKARQEAWLRQQAAQQPPPRTF